MMKIQTKVLVGAAVAAALLFTSFQAASAATIIKLSLGDDSAADIKFDGSVLSTDTDGIGATPGDQNTAVEFLDFLSSNPNIPSAIASYTLSDVAASGPAFTFVIGSKVHVAQDFSGGNFKLWDDANTLLLDVDLGDSALVGPLGQPATAAHFSTSFASVVGGTLAPQIVDDSVSMSLSMTEINGGAGLSVTLGSVLDPFTASATKVISATQIPEPTAALLLVLGALAAPVFVRRGR